MMRRDWSSLTAPEIGALDPDTVVILPVAAVEQHGAHLPLCTDAAIGEGLLAEGLAALPDALPALALPIQRVGWSIEHGAFPGTLSLSAETLLAVIRELGGSVARAGLRRLLIMNSHGGQPQVLEIAARELRAAHGMLVAVAGWTKLGVPEGMFPPEERAHGLHGGALETSLMLHFRPELVRAAARADNRSLAASDRFAVLREAGPISYAWMAGDLHPSGACGDSRAATARTGKTLAAHLARRFAALVQDVHGFPLERLADG